MKKELRDYDPNLDQDEVWDLLARAPKQEPSSGFAKGILAELHAENNTLDEGNILRPSADDVTWWQRSKTKLTLVSLGAAAACAVLGLSIVSQLDSNSSTQPIAHTQPSEAAEPISNQEKNIEISPIFEDIDSVLSTEMIIAAADDPTLYSNSQISSLIGF